MKDFPKVGFGTWEITGEDVKPSIIAAIKSGYKHIDTAQIYNNEYQIGETLEELNIKEDDIYITSKVWATNYRDHAYASVVESLRRLKRKKIDLMLLHAPLSIARKKDVVKAYKELMQARGEELIGEIGVSNFTIELLKEIKKECGEYPFTNQIVLSPTVILEDIEKFCKDNNIALTGYSTLRSYFNPNPWYEGSGMNQEQKTRVEELASKYNKNVGQVLSQWALQNGYHIIPKSVNPDRIKTNIELNDFQLSSEEVNELRSWNTYTSAKMFNDFSNQLEGQEKSYDELQKQGLLFEKNF